MEATQRCQPIRRCRLVNPDLSKEPLRFGQGPGEESSFAKTRQQQSTRDQPDGTDRLSVPPAVPPIRLQRRRAKSSEDEREVAYNKRLKLDDGPFMKMDDDPYQMMDDETDMTTQ